ncbi:MAG TPA: hypothetical protein DCM27_06255 [Rhodospirillaceae bacterium]|nr:hypothetical protein [Rhodospirillaceae bacterium]
MDVHYSSNNVLNIKIEQIIDDASQDIPIKWLVRFENVYAYRVLDEHGLGELWNAAQCAGIKLNTAFRVSHHGWHTESPLSFIFGAYEGVEGSFMLKSDWECVEIICAYAPHIEVI